MMKRFLLLVGVAVVAAAMYVAASPASQQAKGPTAKQFNALKKQVASLSKTETAVKKLAVAEGALLTACMKIAVPINQFGDPDGTGSGTKQGYRYGKTNPAVLSPTTDIFTTGLDVSSTSDTGAAWFTAGDSTCGTALGESTLRHAAAKVGITLPHASLLHTSFQAHGH
jgi:opacity protein-like surface antigen